MKQKKFLGFDVTPRKEYRKEIAKIEGLYLEKCKELDLVIKENKTFVEERNQWKQKYYNLLNDTPARGKGGKFVKRNRQYEK